MVMDVRATCLKWFNSDDDATLGTSTIIEALQVAPCYGAFICRCINSNSGYIFSGVIQMIFFSGIKSRRLHLLHEVECGLPAP